MRERAAPFPILVTLAAAAFAGAALAQPPEVMTSFASGPPSGRYAYGSWTPKTLAPPWLDELEARGCLVYR